MENPSSPLETLRQLKEMLDAGALTPTEFEALKQRLVFTDPNASQASTAAEPPAPKPAAPVAAPVAPPVTPAPPASAPLFTPPAVAATPPPVSPAPAPTQFPLVENVPLTSTLSGSTPPPAAPEPKREPIAPPRPAAAVPPPMPPPPPTRAPEPLPDADAGWVANEFPESEAPAKRSPLALILSIGGLLALLGLVVYLSLNKHPSEHISSTSRTAADSVAAPIETGPQAAPLNQTVAEPETIRVRPTNPAPVVRPRPAAPVRDSAVVVPPTASTEPDSSTTP